MTARSYRRSRSVAAGGLVLVAVGLFAAAAGCSEGSSTWEETGEEDPTVLPTSDASPDETEPAVRNDAGADATDAAPPICSTDGFCHTVVPKGQDLVGVWGDGEGVVWAVSHTGDVLRWDGDAWSVHHQTGVRGYAIAGTGPTDVWVGTETGIVHGQGASSASLAFEPVADLPGDPAVPIKALWATSSGELWAAGGIERFDVHPPITKGRVLHLAPTQEGTRTWSSEDDVVSLGIAFRSVWGSEGTGVWLDGIRVDDEPGQSGFAHVHLLRRADHESTFRSVELPRDPEDPFRPFASRLFAANTSSDTSVWLAGITGLPKPGIWHGTSDDEGATFEWTFRSQGKWDRVALAYWGTAPDDTWAVGEAGLVSHWNGKTWRQAIVRLTNVPITNHVRAIWGKDSTDFWVVGEELALHRTDAGKP